MMTTLSFSATVTHAFVHQMKQNTEKKTMSIKAAEVPLDHVMKKEQPYVKTSFLFVITQLQFYSSYVKRNVIRLSTAFDNRASTAERKQLRTLPRRKRSRCTRCNCRSQRLR